MKIIKCLEKFIDEELHDSEKYIKKALEVKNEYPDVAELLNMLSAEEMKHMNLLHGMIVKLIEFHKKMKGDPPPEMLAVYNYLHEQSIEKVKDIKILQQMYIEM